MATIHEYYRTPRVNASGPESTAEMEYRILGTDDEAAVLALLAATAPAGATVDGWLLTKVDLDIDQIDVKVWRGTASYSKRSRSKDELQEGESSFSFETGGGSLHITHAKATSKYPNTSATPDVNNAIGWDGEQVNGIDIQAPVYNFTETHIIAAATVDSAYKAALFAATGKTNNATFRGFAAGEVLFLGASGSARGDGDWEITYRFSASENKTGLTVAGISGIAKKGWEYLWVSWDNEVDSTNLRTKPKALGVYVQIVYDEADFNTLGIGV